MIGEPKWFPLLDDSLRASGELSQIARLQRKCLIVGLWGASLSRPEFGTWNKCNSAGPSAAILPELRLAAEQLHCVTNLASSPDRLTYYYEGTVHVGNCRSFWIGCC